MFNGVVWKEAIEPVTPLPIVTPLVCSDAVLAVVLNNLLPFCDCDKFK